MDEVFLGALVTDRMTGFTGRVSGIVTYLTGCKQALVVPKIGGDGKMPDGAWIDVQRLAVDAAAGIVDVNNANAGCDVPPPQR